MPRRFYILGSHKKRPDSRKTIFTDGEPDHTFREGIDLELSHWIPNRTPEKYRADTSTEICMKFVADQPVEEWDLAINNHLDVDGVLAVFTLLHPEFSLRHRETIVQAAEIGDFWAWGEDPAKVLFLALTDLMIQLKRKETDIQDIYQACFDATIQVVEHGQQSEKIKRSLNILNQSLELIERGHIERHVVHKRFVRYHVPAELAEANLDKALNIPGFNQWIDDDTLLHPQVRNRYDREKIQLITVETENGWFYDLWYPGYMWADTPDSWRAPGFHFSGSTNGYYYGYQPLERARDRLQSLETGDGKWILAEQLSPFQSIEGRNYPVVLSVMDEQNRPVASKTPPAEVETLLAEAFEKVDS
ncbi:MAG: hypothetical protein H0Z33_04015 [Bacillaceae bacterium]|nr:hypothetical protein [Bacillaceae bacterium]